MSKSKTFVGASALSYNGLISYYPGETMQTTSCKSFHEDNLGTIRLFYLPDVDNDLKFISSNIDTFYSNVRIPTAERAITDYIRYIDLFEDSFLLDGIEEYGRIHNKDFSKLEEVAKEYGILDELHHYITYAYETSSDGE